MSDENKNQNKRNRKGRGNEGRGCWNRQRGGKRALAKSPWPGGESGGRRRAQGNKYRAIRSPMPPLALGLVTNEGSELLITSC